MDKKKTILVIDDHPLSREGIKSLIERNPKFEVVGEAGNGNKGLKLARKLKPDIITVDISLPDKSGIQLTSILKDMLPETHIMIVSMHSKTEYIAEAFQAGAQGYVAKESATENLLKCLDTVSEGEYFIDSSISRQVVKMVTRFPEKEAKITDTAYQALTPREREVMRLIAEGFSKNDVADKLFISSKTVETHRKNFMSKLNLHSTIELVRYAARLGLIDVDLWKE